MTSEDYRQARLLAEKIAKAFAVPRFYTDFRAQREHSLDILRTDPLVERCRRIIQAKKEDFGHGLKHSEKVAVDAGAIVQNESALQGLSGEATDRGVLLAQVASMLHDVRRRMPEHAKLGAAAAAEILEDFPLEECERDWIVCSIRNHEAFIEPSPLEDLQGQMLSDALYDADKFRWGPDNFTDTLWDMISSNSVPIRLVIAHFPKGMEGVKRIIGTFRSQTGKQYGPEFIEIGLALGERLYQELMRMFPPEEK